MNALELNAHESYLQYNTISSRVRTTERQIYTGPGPLCGSQEELSLNMHSQQSTVDWET